MNNDSPNFLDSRTIIGILLVAAAWMGWQFYMTKKYPAIHTPAQTSNAKPGDEAAKPQPEKLAEAKPLSPEVNNIEEKLEAYRGGAMSFDVSSRGMGLRNFQLLQYSDRANRAISFGAEGAKVLPLETVLTGSAEPIFFEVEKLGENNFIGRSRVGDMTIVKSMEVDQSTYSINTKLVVQNPNSQFIGLTTLLVDQIKPYTQASFFSPSFENQEFIVIYDGGKSRAMINPDEPGVNSFNKASVAALGTQYFSQALLDKSPIIPDVKTYLDKAAGLAVAAVTYPVINKTDKFEVSFTGFLGPKYYHILKNVDFQMASLIDFGMFSWLARPILEAMKWFHGIFGNWGIAIILLTLLVRLLVLPFNVMSYKSMKVMQQIQPQIQALREKYKDNQQKLNEEMLQLMKSNKANPLGGCLPLLLQFPVFIALYQVLGHSVELYKAPFGLWIGDLSLKDPWYVLPALMGVTMFVQQKITPSTMDPAQQKIMMFMPVLFSFMMISLPSGLTLYIFVSSLFAVGQQMMFMKMKSI